MRTCRHVWIARLRAWQRQRLCCDGTFKLMVDVVWTESVAAITVKTNTNLQTRVNANNTNWPQHFTSSWAQTELQPRVFIATYVSTISKPKPLPMVTPAADFNWLNAPAAALKPSETNPCNMIDATAAREHCSTVNHECQRKKTVTLNNSFMMSPTKLVNWHKFPNKLAWYALKYISQGHQ